MSDAIELEEIRLSAIEKLGLQTGLKEPNLDRVVQLTALALGARGAAFSVTHGTHQVYVSTFRWDGGLKPADSVLCAQVTKSGDPLFIGDASNSPDYANHPMIREHQLELFCSVPVRTPDKQVVGVLSIFDTESRPMSLANCRLLGECAGLIEDSLMLRSMSVRDELTGLLNRRFFDQQMDIEWRRALRLRQPISFAIADLDYFKGLNDSLGHEFGDLALRNVARELGGGLRRAGDTVARYGGEEFALIMPGTTESDAAEVLDRIREAVAGLQISNPGAPDGHLTITFGVVTAASPSELMNGAASTYISFADKALYAGKMEGRNRVQRYSELIKKIPLVITPIGAAHRAA